MSNGTIFNKDELTKMKKSLSASFKTIEKYNVYLAHPEAIKIAMQSLTLEQRKYTIFIPNKYLKKDKMAVLSGKAKLKALLDRGLI